MDLVIYRTLKELKSRLDEVRHSPRDEGVLRLIVRRPGVNQRETLLTAELDLADGLVGDAWRSRPGWRTADGGPHPGMQLTLMNARAISLIAGSDERWALAGDQLFIDLDLSSTNLPPGTQLAVGGAAIEISDQPHTGCRKFRSRFGRDATTFVNSPVGRALNLRGICAKVVRPGTIRVGDPIRKLSTMPASPIEAGCIR